MTPVLAIENLSVTFRGSIAALRDASLAVNPAECVGVVGESGSGKTQMCLAAMGLLPPGAGVTGSVRFEGREILGAPRAHLNRIRGSKLSMMFQDPMSSLTPHLRIGVQLAEVLVSHAGMSWSDAARTAHRALERVRIPDPGRRLGQYPHELSGGMRQRVMLGMSLLCDPSLVIADEPTTALDVTVQAHIVALLRGLRRESHLSILLISHDLGVVAGLADRVVVMYAGRVVECGSTARILRRAAHPYTAELLKCVPDLNAPRLARMPTLAGQAPGPHQSQRGCAFAPRCVRAVDLCRDARPPLDADAASVDRVACHFPLDR